MQNKNKLLSIAEGLLFISGDAGCSLEDLKVVLELNDEDAKAIVMELKNKYINDSTSGLELSVYAGNKYRVATKKEDADYYAKLVDIKTQAKLSTAAIETLIIVAYKGPITKSEIEDLRGVSADSIIHKLKVRNLIQEAGKSDAVGKPMTYVITDDFMKYFGLNSLDDLPSIQKKEELYSDIFDRGSN